MNLNINKKDIEEHTRKLLQSWFVVDEHDVFVQAWKLHCNSPVMVDDKIRIIKDTYILRNENEETL